MANLDVRGYQAGPGVLANYSSHYPPSLEQLVRLYHAVDAARKAILATCTVMDSQTYTDGIPVAGFAKGALVRHFRLVELAELEPGDPPAAATLANLGAIVKNLRAIKAGLLATITISDGVAAAIKSVIDPINETDPRISNARLLNHKMENPQQVKRIGQKIEKINDPDKRAYVNITKQKAEQLKKAKPEGAADDWWKRDLAAELVPADYGSIHLDFRRLAINPNQATLVSLACTLVHEASHKFVATRDFAYADKREYGSLTREHALMNADCYGLFAVSLYKRHLFSDKQSTCSTLVPGLDLES